MFEYIDIRPRVPLQGGQTLPTASIRGNISFEKVSFAYPTRADQVCVRDELVCVYVRTCAYVCICAYVCMCVM